MTRENVLFGIIGVLLGVIVGYVFATNLNRQSPPPPQRAPAAQVDAELPEDHPPLTADSGGTEPQAVDSGEDAALIEKAQAAPDDFEAQMKAAEVHYRNRRFDEAIELLTRANQLRPENRETVVALGNANFDSGRYEAAERWYTARQHTPARSRSNGSRATARSAERGPWPTPISRRTMGCPGSSCEGSASSVSTRSSGLTRAGR